VLELVLMRACLMLYPFHFEADDDCIQHKSDRSRITEGRVLTRLSSVCWHWYQTLIGWSESSTSHWLRHQIKKRIERKSTHSYTNVARRLWNVVYRTRVVVIPRYLVLQTVIPSLPNLESRFKDKFPLTVPFIS